MKTLEFGKKIHGDNAKLKKPKVLWMGHGAWMGIAWVNMQDGRMGPKHSSQNVTCLVGSVSGAWVA
jgi:hypothetical protein